LVLKKEGMGGGDIKLMAFYGALFGWKIALMSIVFASFIGAFSGIAMLAIRKLRSDHKIPFGPFLALGIWVAVLWGDKILTMYMRLLNPMG
jgi:prepilin signal peptidase PulO-like enzyme (type II secretory pathway)